MDERKDNLTRRHFLRMAGIAGGSAAVHESLVALGLMRHPSVWAGPPKAQPGIGQGKHVVILGAGVGGLATAYWLEESGYQCTILEAQNRLGGRSFTARTEKDVVIEENEDGTRTEQICGLDDDLYLNLGPGRIPYHHRRVIDLCQRLKVPLEVYVHTSDFNLHQMGEENPALNRRRIAFDAQGYISELLAKAINQRALDHELTAEDKEKLLRLVQKFGDLDSRFRYKGSTRTGCRNPPSVTAGCGALEPLGLDVLLESEFWDPCIVGAPRGEARCDPIQYGHGFYQVAEELWQTTSFQPVGGMDKIVQALVENIRGSIVTSAPVEKVALADGGKKVQVSYRKGTVLETKVADFCVSNIPLPVLKDVEAPDFAPHFRDAICRTVFSNACKVGWQANRRFWEAEGIYGGISWINHPITQMWYPSNDYLSRKGVLTGAYNYARTALEFGRLSPKQRLDLAWEGGRLLHPNAFRPGGDIPKDKGMSIAWQNVLYQKGCSAIWDSRVDQDELDYESLLVPDLEKRFYVVGDQVSTLPGWQEGALMSAEHVIGQITSGTNLDLEQMRRDVTSAPMSLDVMG